jgi:hypothetical protein
MADEATVTETTTATVEEVKPESDLGDAGKKALAAERAAKKAAEKQLNELTARLQEYENRDKTEAERLAQRAEQAERERDALRVESLRARVAIAKGLPADLMEFLTAEDEDELIAQADRLMARLASTEPAPPRADTDQGARPGPMALNGDPLLDSLKTKLGIR